MAADQHAPVEPLPQRSTGALHLFDDVGDGHDRAEIVADDGDRKAALVEPACHMAVERWIHGAPIAAVNEHCQRRAFAGRRQKQIDELPRRIAVDNAELGLAGFEHFGAVVFGRARPAGENLRVIRNGDAGTIFGLEVEVGHRALQLSAREIAPCA